MLDFGHRKLNRRGAETQRSEGQSPQSRSDDLKVAVGETHGRRALNQTRFGPLSLAVEIAISLVHAEGEGGGEGVHP